MVMEENSGGGEREIIAKKVVREGEGYIEMGEIEQSMFDCRRCARTETPSIWVLQYMCPTSPYELQVKRHQLA